MLPPRRDDAGHAVRGERDEAQQHAGVDGEVIHALLGLFDERVAEEFPGEVLGLAAHFFERLIDRHGADGHGRVAQNPFARGVDVLAGGKVHDGVRAPLGGPAHLLDFLLDARRDGAVADVGVDLHEEVAPDDHRLGLGVIDVVGMMARPAATSSRTNSGVICVGNALRETAEDAGGVMRIADCGCEIERSRRAAC